MNNNYITFITIYSIIFLNYLNLNSTYEMIEYANTVFFFLILLSCILKYTYR